VAEAEAGRAEEKLVVVAAAAAVAAVAAAGRGVLKLSMATLDDAAMHACASATSESVAARSRPSEASACMATRGGGGGGGGATTSGTEVPAARRLSCTSGGSAVAAASLLGTAVLASGSPPRVGDAVRLAYRAE